MTNDVVVPYLTELGDHDQQARYLPRLTAGLSMGAVAVTEPGTGSDLRAIQTTARWDGATYRITGSKTFISAGALAEFVICVAQVVREDVDGLSLFIVDAGSDGFARGRKLEKVGRRASDTAEMFFDDVRAGEENVIGAIGTGMRQLRHNLAHERLALATSAVAHAERAFEI